MPSLIDTVLLVWLSGSQTLSGKPLSQHSVVEHKTIECRPTMVGNGGVAVTVVRIEIDTA